MGLHVETADGWAILKWCMLTFSSNVNKHSYSKIVSVEINESVTVLSHSLLNESPASPLLYIWQLQLKPWSILLSGNLSYCVKSWHLIKAKLMCYIMRLPEYKQLRKKERYYLRKLYTRGLKKNRRSNSTLLTLNFLFFFCFSFCKCATNCFCSTF